MIYFYCIIFIFIFYVSINFAGCSYADGLVTPEEAALLAFARAYACQNSKVPLGQMAAVGLSKEEVEKLLPPDVFIACQNGIYYIWYTYKKCLLFHKIKFYCIDTRIYIYIDLLCGL